MKNISSVLRNVKMNRICAKCSKEKDISNYYLCLGKIRTECKECTIKRNMAYQKLRKIQHAKLPSDERRKLYMRKYYSENKEKFAAYRATFREKYPNYYKEYFINKNKNE